MLHHVPYIHHADDGYNVGLAPGKVVEVHTTHSLKNSRSTHTTTVLQLCSSWHLYSLIDSTVVNSCQECSRYTGPHT